MSLFSQLYILHFQNDKPETSIFQVFLIVKLKALFVHFLVMAGCDKMLCFAANSG